MTSVLLWYIRTYVRTYVIRTRCMYIRMYVCMYVCCVLCMVGCVFCCIRDELPLSKDPPLEFATLPEFYLDDLAELLLFLSQ